MSIACMAPPMNSNYCYLTIRGVERGSARNKLVEQALEKDVRYILFLDDDTAPPSHTLHKLLFEMENGPEDLGIIGGIYCTKSDPPAPVCLIEEGGGPFWRWRAGEVFEVAGPGEKDRKGGLGTGCMLIKAEVFRKVSSPWFADIYSLDEGRKAGVVADDPDLVRFEMTDDLYFQRKVRQEGYRIWAHGGVLPIHWDQNGKYYILPEGSYPVRHMAPVNNDVDGWMSNGELRWLEDTAKNMDTVVEIGAWKGRSTRALASAKRVISVDHWKGSDDESQFPLEEVSSAYSDWLENTKDLENVGALKMSSIEAAKTFADKSVDMVFIDAAHDYQSVLADIEAWRPKALKIIAGHDYSLGWPDVVKAVNDTFGKGNVRTMDSIWYAEVA